MTKKKVVGNPYGRHGASLNQLLAKTVDTKVEKQEKEPSTRIHHTPNENEQVDYQNFIDELESWGKPND